MKNYFTKATALVLSTSVLLMSLMSIHANATNSTDNSENAIISEELINTRMIAKLPEKPEPVIILQTVEPVGEKKEYDNLELLARVTFAEAGNQSELGKRLVIDTILNRVDSDSRDFKNCNTVKSVCYQSGQFTTVSNGAIWKYPLSNDILDLIDQEIENRTNDEVLWFRTGRYHSFGRRLFLEGAHYFSGL